MRIYINPTAAARQVNSQLPTSNFQLSGRVVLIVGPEGDFTPEEVGRMVAVGARPVGLGANRLRSGVWMLKVWMLKVWMLCVCAGRLTCPLLFTCRRSETAAIALLSAVVLMNSDDDSVAIRRVG